MKTFTKDETSLLLFFETAVVDFAGRYNSAQCNNEDRANTEKWKQSGYIEAGRVCSQNLSAGGKNLWVKLSPEAMEDAQRLRRERAERMWQKREWMTAEEYRNAD